MPCCGGRIRGGGAAGDGAAFFVLLDGGLDAGFCLGEWFEGLAIFSDHTSVCLACMLLSAPLAVEMADPHL